MYRIEAHIAVSLSKEITLFVQVRHDPAPDVRMVELVATMVRHSFTS